MKFGVRKPSIKKSIKARTTGKVKRAIKQTVNPIYSKKGTGFIKNPEKSIKNSIYHKTTFDIIAPLKKHSSNNFEEHNYTYSSYSNNKVQSPQIYTILENNTVKIGKKTYNKKQIKKYLILYLFLSILYIFIGIYFFPFLIISLFLLYASYSYYKIYKLLK